MTILAAFGDGDDFVLGADGCDAVFSNEYGVYLWRPADKFHLLEWSDGHVAYGYAGSAGTDSFGSWLAGVTASVRSWGELEPQVATWLQTTNAPFRSDPRRDELCMSTLVAGVVGGEPRALGMSANGERVGDHNGLVVVGPAGKVARGAWNALPTPHRPDHLRKVLEPIVEAVVGLKGPVRSWRLTPRSFDVIVP